MKQSKLLFLLFLLYVRMSSWIDFYPFSFNPDECRNGRNTVSKSTKDLSNSFEGKRKENCRTCVGSISATSFPGEGGGPWGTPALC